MCTEWHGLQGGPGGGLGAGAFCAWLCHRARPASSCTQMYTPVRAKHDFAPCIRHRPAPCKKGGRLLRVNCQRTLPVYGIFESGRNGPGYIRRHKILLLFPLPVKVTIRGDNQTCQGGVTTRTDRTPFLQFPKKNDDRGWGAVKHCFVLSTFLLFFIFVFLLARHPFKW